MPTPMQYQLMDNTRLQADKVGLPTNLGTVNVVTDFDFATSRCEDRDCMVGGREIYFVLEVSGQCAGMAW